MRAVLSLSILITILAIIHYNGVSSAPPETNFVIEQYLDSKNSSYINCKSTYLDYVLYNGPVEKKYKVLQVISLDLPISTGFHTIYCVEAIDVKADGNGAAVSISSGGLGYNYVTLHFKSQRNHGIHFNVTILGH